jgi:peptidoglycan/xylan/chitin deacetylase (PgdA/CDA1 family)
MAVLDSNLLATRIHQVGRRRTALNLAAGTLWHIPGSFGIVRILGPRYSLRCVLFHDVSDTESSFTKGLRGTITRKNFEAVLKFITRYYTPVSLQDVIADSDGRALPPRPVLVTFDDAYASVSEFAAPLCSRFRVPAVFFVNGVCLDNQRLALDNLVCYVANVCGMGTINAAVRALTGVENLEVRSLAQVFTRFLPAISLSAREVFRDALVQLTRISEGDLAAAAGLYLSSQQLRDLATFNFEIGNHTYTHVNCRSLSVEEFAGEIDRNKAVLEATSRTKVRSFSVPYGSAADLTTEFEAYLQRSGYEAIFFAEGRVNSLRAHRSRLDRVSIQASTDAAFFSEIEVLPRLRKLRNSLFGVANVGPDWTISQLDNVRSTTFQCASKEGAVTSGERN